MNLDLTDLYDLHDVNKQCSAILQKKAILTFEVLKTKF